MNLRIGVLWPGAKVLLREESNADPRRQTPRTTGPLIRLGLADGLNLKLLNLPLDSIALDPRKSRVHHHPDAWNREGGLSDVGGQNNPLPPRGSKDTVLIALCEPRKERQDVGVLEPRGQRIGHRTNLTFARQKDQHIRAVTPFGQGKAFLGRRDDSVNEVLSIVSGGSPAHLDWIEAPAHLEDGCGLTRRSKMPSELLCIKGGGGNDHLEIGARIEQLLEVAQEEVYVETSLMRLINDDGVVASQLRVGLGLRE